MHCCRGVRDRAETFSLAAAAAAQSLAIFVNRQFAELKLFALSLSLSLFSFRQSFCYCEAFSRMCIRARARCRWLARIYFSLFFGLFRSLWTASTWYIVVALSLFFSYLSLYIHFRLGLPLFFHCPFSFPSPFASFCPCAYFSLCVCAIVHILLLPRFQLIQRGFSRKNRNFFFTLSERQSRRNCWN